MGIFRSAYQVLSNEGLLALLKETKQYIRYRTLSAIPEPIYQLYLPNTTSFEVDGIVADFDMAIVSQHRDFRHDFHSEKNILSSFVSDLRPDDVIYDIGANVGIYSAFAGQVLDDGYVVAFEPHPVAVPTLYRNLRSNCTDFQLFQLALSSGAGYGRMEVDFSTDANILATSGVNVRLEQLKDVINQSKIPAPSVVKIDVEGAERDVLGGFGEIFEEIRAIYIEVHKNRGEEFNSNVEDIVDILDLHFDEVSEIGEQERGEGIQTHIRAGS